MNYQLLFHLLAKEDYKEAFSWYSNISEELGERFSKAVRHKLQDIIAHPKAYSSRGNIKFREAKVNFFPYLIVFKIKNRRKVIFIASMHHTKRNPNKKYRK